MKKVLLPLLLLLLTSFTITAQDCKTTPPSDGNIYDWCYKKNEGTSWDTSPYKAYIINGMPFRLLYPLNYNPASPKKYPLVILLHGIGQAGTDNNHQLKYPGESHLRAVKRGAYDGFVMVPQSPNELFGENQHNAIIAFVEYATSKLNVDDFRVQLEGYSGGGATAWKLANWYPKLFTAAIPMSSADGKDYVQNLKYTAIWHSQGGLDTRPLPSAGKAVASAYKAAGANYTYQLYPQLGHGTWQAMYKEPDFFPFLMRNSMLRIHVLHFKYNFCEGEEVRGIMGVKQGFEGYEWRKDGNLIAGATANELNFQGEGLYTVRIKHKGAWSEWSEAQKIQRIGSTATPTIAVSGPTALPTLDGRTTVTLMAPTGYQSYLWSNGSDLEMLEVKAAGKYSVSVTEPFGCPSAYSAPVSVTYNKVGVLPAPGNFKVSTVSETALSLSWSDNSTNENGFEIYRSRIEDGPWTLAAQLPANTTSYTDNDLATFTRYHYAIRAVNDDGGSTYTNASGKTKADNSAPTAPQSLEVYKRDRTSIGLQWLPSEDNADGAGKITYEVFINNKATLIGSTTNTSLLISDLTEKQFYNFAVRAKDQIGNVSEFSNQVVAGTFYDGLTYTYHEGEITTVFDISLLPVLKKGRIPNFDIVTPRPAGIRDYFAFTFEGYINIPTDGEYTFFTTSDDGSTLNINGKQVVNNNGKHASRERAGNVTLTKGFHHIKVLYFEYSGNGEVLEVRWQGPGISKQLIPDAAFKENFTSPPAPKAPAELTASAKDESSILLSWTNNDTEATGIEIYHSTTNDGPFLLRKTVEASAVSYTDISLKAGTTYFYKIRAVNNSGQSAYAGQDATGTWANATTLGSSSENSAPVLATVGTINAPYGSTTTLTLRATDKDGDALSFNITNLPSFATLTDNGNGTATLSITPGIDDEGSYSDIMISVSDGKGGTDEESVSIVVGQNRAPGIIRISPVSLKENKSQTIEVLAYDADGDKVKLSLMDAPPFMALYENGNNKATVDITPRFGHAGEYTITVQAIDSKGAATTSTFKVYVIKVNAAYTVKVNFNSQYHDQAAAPWNNFASTPTAGSMVVNLKDTENQATNLNLTILDYFSQGESGAVTGNNTGVYPDAVLKTYLYGSDDLLRRIRLSNLDPDLTYRISVLGGNTNEDRSAAPTEFSIGNQIKLLDTYNNTNSTINFDGLRTADKEIILGIKRSKENTYAFINALVIEAYYVDNSTPLTPTALTASRSSETAARLEWRDNATNETAYKIFKSTDGENFTEIASLAANTTTYTDPNITAEGNFYYRIQASNANGVSKWSNVAGLYTNEGEPENPNPEDPNPEDPDPENPDPENPDPENPDPENPDNRAPVISNFPKSVTAPEGTTTEILFGLTDPNGDELRLITRYMPHFARIEQVSATQGKIILSPSIKDMGYYAGIQFTATDGSLEADVTFSITVYNSEKTAVYVNVGNSSVAPKPWNNINTYGGVSNKQVLKNMIDESGAGTGYSLTLIDPWSSNKLYGETSGNDSGVYPDVVTKSAYIINPGKTVRFKVSGLHADLRYNFVFFGSNIFKSFGGTTNYTIGNETVSLAIQSNINETVQINGIKANANGEVVISVSGAADASKGGYLNAFAIEQYADNSSKILRPGKFQAYGVSKSQIDLKWNDISYQETGFEIWRRSLPSGEFSRIGTAPANATSYSDKDLAINSGYEYKVRAVNGSNASDFSDIKQAATLQYKAYINFNYTKNAKNPWNNLDKRPTTGYTWYNFKNEDLQNTGINLRLEESFDGNNPFGPDANGKGIYPDKVIKTFYFNEIGTVARMRVFGLDNNLTYNFRFFAASSFPGGESGISEYRIGTKKVTLDVEKNISNTAVIRDVQPENGSILIEVEAGEFARYGFINALVIEARDGNKEKKGASNTRTEDGTLSVNANAKEQNQITIVYPNPTRGELNVDFTSKAEGTCLLQVMDTMGRIVYSEQVSAQEGSNTFTLDLRNPTIRAGIYILRVKSMDFESKVIRFIKQ